jgi:hypothetical protein
MRNASGKPRGETVLPADDYGANGGLPDLPEVVLAPARPDIRPGHAADVVFEVRRLSDGGRALPVFTTVERLIAALGPVQPWVALPLQNIQHIMGGTGVARIVIDPAATPGAWRWQVSDIEALAWRH